MTRLMGLDGRRLTDYLTRVVPILKPVLWKPETTTLVVPYEGLISRFRVQRVSLAQLNRGISRAELIEYYGQFPELFERRPELIYLAHNLIDAVLDDIEYQALGIDEKKKRMNADLTMGLLHELVYGERTFRGYFPRRAK